MCAATIAPDIVWHLETNDDDAQMQFARSLAQEVGPVVCIQVVVLLRVEVRWVVVVLALSLALTIIPHVCR